MSLVLRFSNSGTVGISVKGDRPRETNNLPAKDNHAPLPNDPRIPLGNDIRKIKIQSIERRIGYASPFQSDFYRSCDETRHYGEREWQRCKWIEGSAVALILRKRDNAFRGVAEINTFLERQEERGGRA